MYKTIATKAAWNSKELQSNNNLIYELREMTEINTALDVAKSSQKSLFQLKRKDFPLPTLSYKLSAFSEILENDIGIVIMRGLPIENYSYHDQQIIFWCIGLYLGTAVSQSNIGELMMDIKHTGGVVDQRERGINTPYNLTYHTDLADVVGMLLLQNAKSGGETRLVSSVAVHNEILRTRPELLEILYQPYCHVSPPWDSAKVPLEMRPVFSMHKNRFVCNYLRPFIDWAQENDQAPPLTRQQIKALDYFDEISNDPIFSTQFILQPGEMMFFNNFVILHSRTAFENDTDKHRHLLRLWLSVPNSRDLPESYKVSYRTTRAGFVRGGIQG